MLQALKCLLLGHDWRRTVVTEATYRVYAECMEDDYFARALFHERMCARCLRSEALHQHLIETWQSSMYDPTPPPWVDAPPRHFPYPDDDAL